jgi:hypothetical protein
VCVWSVVCVYVCVCVAFGPTELIMHAAIQ